LIKLILIFVIVAFFKCVINYAIYLLVSMSNANISLNKNMAFLLIAMLSIAVIVGFSQFTNVHALSKYFNCTTKKANGDSNFGIQEAFTCYDKVFKGAQNYANETYQNPDINNLAAIKEVVNDNSKTSGKPTTTTTGNDNVQSPMVKASKNDDKLILPIKLNDDLKTKHISKTDPDEKPNAPDTTNTVSKTDPDEKPNAPDTTNTVSKTDPDEKPNAPHTTNMNSEKSAKSTPDFQLNSDIPSNPESFDLPFSAVIPK
jgi:hypothetical protein